jgi:hypothetical protein
MNKIRHDLPVSTYLSAGAPLAEMDMLINRLRPSCQQYAHRTCCANFLAAVLPRSTSGSRSGAVDTEHAAAHSARDVGPLLRSRQAQATSSWRAAWKCSLRALTPTTSSNRYEISNIRYLYGKLLI